MALVDEKLAEEFCLEAVPHLEALIELGKKYGAEGLIWAWIDPDESTYRLEGSGMGRFTFDNLHGYKELHTRRIVGEQENERKEEDGGV